MSSSIIIKYVISHNYRRMIKLNQVIWSSHTCPIRMIYIEERRRVASFAAHHRSSSSDACYAAQTIH